MGPKRMRYPLGIPTMDLGPQRPKGAKGPTAPPPYSPIPLGDPPIPLGDPLFPLGTPLFPLA